MNRERYDVSTLGQFVGQELGVSDWLTVDKERINEFADCTDDHQWIHVDIERAQRESPLGSTIAHGYLTLALLPAMLMELNIVPQGVSQALNYGLDRVRFMARWCARRMRMRESSPSISAGRARCRASAVRSSPPILPPTISDPCPSG